jgi:hypothetical protein
MNCAMRRSFLDSPFLSAFIGARPRELPCVDGVHLWLVYFFTPKSSMYALIVGTAVNLS